MPPLQDCRERLCELRIDARDVGLLFEEGRGPRVVGVLDRTARRLGRPFATFARAWPCSTRSERNVDSSRTRWPTVVELSFAVSFASTNRRIIAWSISFGLWWPRTARGPGATVCDRRASCDG